MSTFERENTWVTFLVGYRKVYSVRCEADVVMTSPTPVFANYEKSI
jgi:hypothetical protein